MSAASASAGAVKMVGGGVQWAANNIVAAVFLVVGVVALINVTPYAVCMLWYHDRPQVGVNKATEFVKATWTIAGAGYESKDVVSEGFNEGQAMTQKSLAKSQS